MRPAAMRAIFICWSGIRNRESLITDARARLEEGVVEVRLECALAFRIIEDDRDRCLNFLAHLTNFHGQ